MKRTPLCSFLAMFVLMPLTLSAQENRNEEEHKDAPSTVEITVNAPESLTHLRREIDQAEEVMFNLFNELNTDNKYDIKCRYIRRWQSKIREQVCAPVFYMNSQEEEAELALKNMGFVGISVENPGNTSVERDYRILQEKMETIIVEHPEFQEVVDQYNGLLENLESARQAR